MPHGTFRLNSPSSIQSLSYHIHNTIASEAAYFWCDELCRNNVYLGNCISIIRCFSYVMWYLSESENFSYFVRILQDIRKSHFLIILRNIRKATDHAKCPQLASSTRNIGRYSNSGLLCHFQNPRLHIFVTMKPRKYIAWLNS